MRERRPAALRGLVLNATDFPRLEALSQALFWNEGLLPPLPRAFAIGLPFASQHTPTASRGLRASARRPASGGRPIARRTFMADTTEGRRLRDTSLAPSFSFVLRTRRPAAPRVVRDVDGVCPRIQAMTVAPALSRNDD